MLSCLRLCRHAVALMLVAAATLAQAATPDSGQASMIEALTRARSAVVGLKIEAAQGARSAQTLGQERSGSGVVIGPDGLILTIGYLITEADTVEITTQEGRTVPARVVAYDIATGFGLLRAVLPLRVPQAPLGSASELRTGEPLVAALGGEDADVAMTQLVSRRAFSGYWEYHIEMGLFTSPPVGNHSGAGLFNARGELVGIGSLIVSDTRGDGRRLPGNMFVPIDLLKPILAEMEQTGSTRQSRRAWIGLTSTEQAGRVQVMRVTRDSPAQAAGLEAGDIVLAVDGTPIATLEQFYKRLWSHTTPEDELELTVLKGAEIRKLTVKPVDRMKTLVKPAGV